MPAVWGHREVAMREEEAGPMDSPVGPKESPPWCSNSHNPSTPLKPKCTQHVCHIPVLIGLLKRDGDLFSKCVQWGQPAETMGLPSTRRPWRRGELRRHINFHESRVNRIET